MQMDEACIVHIVKQPINEWYHHVMTDCMQIMELEQKMQESTRLIAKLQGSETDLQDRLNREARACEVTLQMLAVKPCDVHAQTSPVCRRAALDHPYDLALHTEMHRCTAAHVNRLNDSRISALTGECKQHIGCTGLR